MTQALRNARAITGQFAGGQLRIASQELIDGSLEADKSGRIDAVSEVRAHGTDRRFIANPKPDRMDCVVEILVVFLRESQRHSADAAVNISHVVEKDSADV